MRGLKFFHSTAKCLLGAGCVGLSCLLAIALMACGGDTPPTDSPASGSTDTPANAFASVSAGGYHTCGVRADRSVECWGANESPYGSGQASPPGDSFASFSVGGDITCWFRPLAHDTFECKEESGVSPDGRATPPVGPFVWVSAGGYLTCGLRVDGSVECWGDDGTFARNSGFEYVNQPGGSVTVQT